MSLTDLQYERETVLSFNDAEDNALFWSAQPSFQRKMRKLGVEPVKTAEGERGRTSCWYVVPKSWIKVKPTVKRGVTKADYLPQNTGKRGRPKKGVGLGITQESYPPETPLNGGSPDQERAFLTESLYADDFKLAVLSHSLEGDRELATWSESAHG